MISKISHKDEKIAKQILNIQIPAYEVEAKLINFDGIPQLKDTPETIITSSETFLGYLMNNDLVAFLSFSEDEQEYQICRLVVHPSHFQKGIARKLLKYFLNEIVNQSKKVIVSTGSKNVPAINLYESEGFLFQKNLEVAPNIFITLFEKS